MPQGWEAVPDVRDCPRFPAVARLPGLQTVKPDVQGGERTGWRKPFPHYPFFNLSRAIGCLLSFFKPDGGPISAERFFIRSRKHFFSPYVARPFSPCGPEKSKETGRRRASAAPFRSIRAVFPDKKGLTDCPVNLVFRLRPPSGSCGRRAFSPCMVKGGSLGWLTFCPLPGPRGLRISARSGRRGQTRDSRGGNLTFCHGVVADEDKKKRLYSLLLALQDGLEPTTP